MFEIIEGILTKPLYTFLSVLIIWGFLYLLLSRVFNVREIIWIRLEYIWIFIGLIGLLIVVDENRKIRSSNELDNLKIRIERNLDDLISYTQMTNHCFKYNNSGLLPQDEFDRRQAQQDSICKWMPRVRKMAELSKSKDNAKLNPIPTLKVENYQKIMEYEHVLIDHNRLNEQIERRNELNSIVGNDFWEGYKYTIGVLLMVFAFALRLSIIKNKINAKKNAAEQGI